MELNELSLLASESTSDLHVINRRKAGAGRHAEGHAPTQRDAADGRPTDSDSKSTGTTVVLPYVGSSASNRTRWLRAWMMAAPADLAALLSPLLVTDRFWRGTIAFAVVTVIAFAVGGLYRGRRHISILDELPSLSLRLLASASLVGVIAAQRHDSGAYVADFMHGIGLTAAGVVLGRILTRSAVVFARNRRWVEHNALVIGSGPTAIDLARLLKRYPRYGLRFAGCLDAAEAANSATLPLLAPIEQLADAIRMTECDVIIIADHHCPEPRLMEIVRQSGGVGCDLWVVPRLWGSRSLDKISDHIGAIPVVHISDPGLTGWRWKVKRATDIAFASLALMLLSPILLLAAVGTRLDGGPGIIFRQERIGRFGIPFEVLKFRSMRPANERESQTNWSIADDKRVSAWGRLMRRTSLDELPQLWNIFRGDMTFVGPRPERPYFVDRFTAEFPGYELRHRAPVGLTGLAQVSGLRGDTPIADRARFDNYYIENWSLWLDVKIVIRTLSEVFRGGGR